MIPFNMEIQAEYRYLHLPIQIGAEKIAMQLVCEAEVVREFDVELAVSGKRDWWAYYDISAFMGQKIELKTLEKEFTASQANLLSKMITQSEDLLSAQDLYRERHRPQLHFTPKRGWSNDPNGMVYDQGTWHLFFQHNPFSTKWGAMHWGHATSPDLVYWTEQAIALYPRSIQDAVWSGGAVLDTNHTSGFGAGDQTPMVLSFTSTGRGECLAYSLDKGRTFREWEGNPFLAHQGRDPKIIWYEDQKKWVMIVYEEGDGQRGYDLYDSSDLTHWRHRQHLAGWFECPELFSLPIEGSESSDHAWVVYGSIYQGMSSAFQVGSFDGECFMEEGNPQVGHAGPHFYAAQVFSHAPQGRRIMMGWLREADYPGMPFGNGMSVPLELSLRVVEEQVRLCFYPVQELEKLRLETTAVKNLTAGQANALFSGITSELVDIEIEIGVEEGKPFQIDLDGYAIAYEPGLERVSFGGKTAARQPGKRNIHLRILIDRAVSEVFVDRGWGAFACMTLYEAGGRKIRLHGDVLVLSLKVHILDSIWRTEASPAGE